MAVLVPDVTPITWLNSSTTSVDATALVWAVWKLLRQVSRSSERRGPPTPGTAVAHMTTSFRYSRSLSVGVWRNDVYEARQCHRSY